MFKSDQHEAMNIIICNANWMNEQASAMEKTEDSLQCVHNSEEISAAAAAAARI